MSDDEASTATLDPSRPASEVFTVDVVGVGPLRCAAGWAMALLAALTGTGIVLRPKKAVIRLATSGSPVAEVHPSLVDGVDVVELVLRDHRAMTAGRFADQWLPAPTELA